MRNLVSIQKIESLSPIEGKDRIELAKVLDWFVVVEKRYKVGDLVVYAEIDSLFPEKPEFEFLRSCKFRIKTKKLGGYLSQGICFPLDILGNKSNDVVLGEDVTELIGVEKYEPKAKVNIECKSRGNFPSFIPKTDETRVQSIKSVLQEYEGQEFFITEKLDGSSMTVYLKNGNFGVCSRNLDLQETEGNTFWNTAKEYKLKEKLEKVGKNIALQGELIGPNIQENIYKLQKHQYRVFNVFDIDEKRYLNFDEFVSFTNEYEIETVPILNRSFSLISDVSGLLQMAEIKSSLNEQTDSEGIVLRPLKENFHPKLGRLSFKAISNKYLLKNNK